MIFFLNAIGTLCEMEDKPRTGICRKVPQCNEGRSKDLSGEVS